MSNYLIDARIISVDTERLTCICQSADATQIYDEVGYSCLGTNGEGIEIAPMEGSLVIIRVTPDGAFIEKMYSSKEIDPVAQSNGNWFSKFTNYIGRLAPNSPFERPKLPGDVSLSAVNGAGVLASRGKALSLFSGDLAQVHILGFLNTIKAIASNFDVIGSGFRFFTTSQNGNVVTSFCFSSSDSNMTRGAQEDDTTLSDNFEFQIDFDGDNMTLFSGPLHPETRKRINRTIFNIKADGSVTLRQGEDISDQNDSKVYSHIYYGYTGVINETIFSDKHEAVYNRSVARTSEGGEAVLLEYVKGDIIREATGNIIEIAGDSIRSKADIISSISEIDETITNIRRKTAGQNVDNIDTSPKPGANTGG